MRVCTQRQVTTLSGIEPDLIKLDMELVRGIDVSPARQAILDGLLAMTTKLDIEMLAEGVETATEFALLRGAGVRLFQGYLFARPQTERFAADPEIAWQ